MTVCSQVPLLDHGPSYKANVSYGSISDFGIVG
jgi:hypothetical protein